MNKKFTMMAALAAISISPLFAEVESPLIMQDFEGLAISPDGRFVASEISSCVEIYDTDMDESVRMLSNGETTYYGIGMGNPFNADGSILVGSSSECGGVGYYKNNSWHKLAVPNPGLSNLANSITPDSRRICGLFATSKVTVEDTSIPMFVPGYWEMNANGSYGEPVMLPYPEKDITGRTPQYVTAKCISDDGKVIAGCVRDYSGFIVQVIVYTEDADGNWTYSIPSPEFYNPNNVRFPAWPGEAPVAPNPEDFFTQSEKDSYDVAHDLWERACTLSGNWDYTTEPQPVDFLSGDSKAVYDEALRDYDGLLAKWQTAYDKFAAVFSSMIESGHTLPFNLLFLSGDGKKVVSGTSKSYEDPYSWYGFSEKSAPVVFNLEDGSYKLYSYDDNAMPSSIADDGTIFAVVNTSTDPSRAVVYPPEAESALPLYKYMEGRNPEVSYWILDNMSHDLEYYDFEIDQVIEVQDVECTGLPRTSRDISTIITNVENLWDYSTDSNIFCYILPGSEVSSVKGISKDFNAEITVLPGGVVEVKGDVDQLIISATDGTVVFNTSEIDSEIHTGVAPGVYILTAVNAHARKSMKAIF